MYNVYNYGEKKKTNENEQKTKNSILVIDTCTTLKKKEYKIYKVKKRCFFILAYDFLKPPLTKNIFQRIPGDRL